MFSAYYAKKDKKAKDFRNNNVCKKTDSVCKPNRWVYWTIKFVKLAEIVSHVTYL